VFAAKLTAVGSSARIQRLPVANIQIRIIIGTLALN
jgi:hypothetical protein